jgi:putative Holliday junction resolvase
MENPQRVLALDLGKKRIGLALSDELGITAQGLPTLYRTTIREDLRHLSHLIRQNDVAFVLLGLPLHLSGTEGRQAAWVREFGERLRAETGVRVKYWDERLTTVEASRVLKQSGISLQKRIRAVDKLSAVILLESYLASSS